MLVIHGRKPITTRRRRLCPGGYVQLPGGYVQLPGGYVQLPEGYVQLPGGYVGLPGGYVQLPGGYVGRAHPELWVLLGGVQPRQVGGQPVVEGGHQQRVQPSHLRAVPH